VEAHEVQEVVVRHVSEGTGEDRLKVDVERNSKGFNYAVSYRGKDEQDVLDTVSRVLEELRIRIKGLEEAEQ